MFDMMKMMGQIKEVQSKMKEAQEGLKDIIVQSESGAGMVKATINGQKQIVGLEIDASIVNSADADMMKDLVVAAVNKALEEVEVKSKEHIKNATQGMIPNIPGFDLNNLV